MTSRHWTGACILVAGAAFLVSESPALANRQEGDTWSEIGNDAIKAQPALAMLLGATVAHIAGGVPAAHRFCARHPLMPLGIGIAVGALCWPPRGLKTR